MTQNWSLNILVNLIMSQYFNNSICIIYTFDDNKEPVHLSTIPAIMIDIDHFDLDPDRICRNFLIHCTVASSGLMLVEIFIKLNTDGMYNNRKYVIIIDDEEVFKDFFFNANLNFIRDVLIIYIKNTKDKQDKQQEILLYTHKYVGVEGNNDPVLLDIWFAKNQSFKYKHNLFPDKVTDQQGRELRVPCMYRLPYSNCDLSKFLKC